MTITPIRDGSFGATVRRVSLAGLGDHEHDEIDAALLRFGFLLFPAQFISDDEQASFGKRFGELEFGAVALSNQASAPDGSLGDICDIATRRMRLLVGNE